MNILTTMAQTHHRDAALAVVEAFCFDSRFLRNIGLHGVETHI
jgi:hypothetical protein